MSTDTQDPVMKQCCLFPTAYISRVLLEKLQPKLSKLELHTETTISYDLDEQYFTIEGEGAFKAEQIIREDLLPKLNATIDENYLKGTYEPLEYGSYTATSTTAESTTTPILVVNHKPELEQAEHDFYVMNDENKSVESLHEDTIVRLFEISPRIEHPSDLLIGPPQQNMQSADYLALISTHTNTECTLIERIITIEGHDEESTQDAFDRFTTIQKTYLGQNRCLVTPCIHYPLESESYSLFFCNLHSYRHKRWVNHQHETNALYVLLPVFQDPVTQDFQQPVDLVHQSLPHPSIGPLVTQSPCLSNHIPPHTPIRKQKYTQPISNPPSPSPESLQPLQYWDSDRDYINSYNTGNLSFLSSERLGRAFTPSSSNGSSPMPFPNSMFPELPLPAPSPIPTPTNIKQRFSKGYTPSLKNDKRKTHRVIHIVPQKANSSTPKKRLSRLTIAKEYNFTNIKAALREGLESVRGFKGEVILSAKFGKILWSNLKPEIHKQLWPVTDIKDIIVQEYKIRPLFSNMTTNNDILVDIISEKLPIPFNKTSTYEFHCNARNSPNIPYKPVVVHMNQGAVDVKKVVITEHNVAEIDWVTLDRKYDFQLTLSTKQLIRCDVKPYNTFIKWVSICPITRQMTFENVPKFLEVSHVLLKEKTKYRVPPFTLEITKIEVVQMSPVKGSNQKITAKPGGDRTWYDIELQYPPHISLFEQNRTLEPGCKARWTPDEILGGRDCSVIGNYIPILLKLTELIERAVKEGDV
ncbi:hypothetical protein BDB01DRAFT_784848 [Pilobolus umbonatus]|nr:hypothetical protein BDB01DRAFT_784848 [Pilobolus umbonatus]